MVKIPEVFSTNISSIKSLSLVLLIIVLPMTGFYLGRNFQNQLDTKQSLLTNGTSGNRGMGLVKLPNRAPVQPTNIPPLNPIPTEQPKFGCDNLSIPGYELFDPYTRGPEQLGNPQTGNYMANLKGKDPKDLVRIYNDIQNEGERTKPVVVKIYSGNGSSCWKEAFSQTLTGNEIGDIQLLHNFFDSNSDTLLIETVDTGYGSGFSSYLKFITFKNGDYRIIDGPQIDELSSYKLLDHNILVARAIWGSNEAHFDAHQYQLEKYIWNGTSYTQMLLGTTKNKYGGNINTILNAEPDVLLSSSQKFISQDQALKVISQLPDGLLFDPSLKDQMGIVADNYPTIQNPYWDIRIYAKNASQNAGVLGTVSWAYVDATSGKFLCAWNEYGKVNEKCMGGPPFN